MSTKSYTLADGSTATVNATDNGIPFNEGMNVLSKAIKAKINTSSGGGKKVPTLILNNVSSLFHDDTFTVTYDGDGEIKVSGYSPDSHEPEYLGNNVVRCGGSLGRGVVYVLETANYYSAVAEFSWSDYD